jgi:hypothetical protein
MPEIDESGPTLDQWGFGAEAPVATAEPPSSGTPDRPAPDAPALRARPRISWPIAGIAFVVVAAAVAIALHVAGGVSPSPRALAAAVNLRASDVPGFHVDSGGGGTIGGQPDAQFKHCFGAALNGGPADSSSPNFIAGSGLQIEEVSSSVGVTGSPAVVADDFALIRNRRFLQCFASAMDAMSVTTSGGLRIAFSGTHVTSLPVAVAGADHSFDVRISTTLKVSNAGVPVYLDVYGFAIGRDELSLVTFAVAQPVADATAQRLSSLLVGRALANPH